MAIASRVDTKLDFEVDIQNWEETGLLKASLFKSSIATIEKDFVITKIGALSKIDVCNLEMMIEILC